MKNQKGFTLVELIASFTLALVIMFFLFQIVIILKEIYVSSGLKTEMLIRQANLAQQIGSDLKDKTVTDIVSCGTDCYTFKYASNIEKTFKVDRNKKTVSYGSYQVVMLEGSTIGPLSVTKKTVPSVATGGKNTIVTIDLPVTNKVVVDRNFGLHMVYQYDSRLTNISL